MSTHPARKVHHSLPIVKDSKLPSTRADCIGGPRPCPHERCRYHLADDRHGPETCVLDVVDRGEQSLEVVGAVLGISKQAVQQAEARALMKIQRNAARGAVLALSTHADVAPGEVTALVDRATRLDPRALERARKDRDRKRARARAAAAAAPLDAGFLIFDVGDATYHLGAGRWSQDRKAAESYPSRRSALLMLDEVDGERIMCDRLFIVER